uniref:type I protein arginine methyltransferase n=1 Tax=Panagrellus redivivus TaxID=6233 RepID=A0A7E4WCA6_PANRE
MYKFTQICFHASTAPFALPHRTGLVTNSREQCAFPWTLAFTVDIEVRQPAYFVSLFCPQKPFHCLLQLHRSSANDCITSIFVYRCLKADMTDRLWTRPCFGRAIVAIQGSTENDGNAVYTSEGSGGEFDIFISSDDRTLKLVRVSDQSEQEVNLPDYRAVPIKANMVMLFAVNVTEYSPEAAPTYSIGLTFPTPEEAAHFCKAVKFAATVNTKAPTKTIATDAITNGQTASEFDSRTEENSALQYFQFYSWLAQQQNMMQDFVRTSTYQKAMHLNPTDFQGKVVLDVGAGSGVLSFFAVQAGAKKVYAVEASQMAAHCTELVRSNNLSDKITVVPGKIEEINLPEPVDIIISEPMGYLLVNERMLESYMFGRKFLKPEGRMFPSTGTIFFSLFNDDNLYYEYSQKYNFWTSTNFLGIDLSSLRGAAYQEIFKQPIVDSWHPSILMSDYTDWAIDFKADPVERLHDINVDYTFTATRAGFCHGVATWFDVSFLGTDHTTYLSTAPTAPLTHWYQVRCPILNPFMMSKGDRARAIIKMVANERQSYDITMTVMFNGTTQTLEYDLKNPSFRYNGTTAGPAPGLTSESATAQLATTSYVQDPQTVYVPQQTDMHNYVYVDPYDVTQYNGNGEPCVLTNGAVIGNAVLTEEGSVVLAAAPSPAQ